MKKHKKLKIFLIIIAVIIAILAALAIWQKDNIKAVMYFLNYSDEDLEEIIEEDKNELITKLDEMNINVPRELTEEEIKALEDGSITENEAVEISLGMTTLAEKIEEKAQKAAAEKVEATKPQTQSGSAQSSSSGASGLIAQLYVLESTYSGKIDALAGQAKAEYSSTPSSARTAGWKSSMLAKYSGRAAALEGECDARVEALISKIRAELERTGGDTSIISTIRSTYAGKKQAKKAQYMNAYLK